ncbi:MAG: acyltransferase [Azonexaceae bacterium]|nr:acyltransferase [Azonexaceae bacterium]
MKTAPSRMPLIDALKAVASQLVMLHHIAIYGPLAAAGALHFPELSGWFAEYGRIAVQVFLVIGGFLAARSLSPDGRALAGNPLPLIGRRYLRLVLPFLVAITFAVIASAIADQWMSDPAVPERASFGQWLAHALLLHGVLGADSLSAGVWYVAIDFQLFALFALLLWAGRRPLGVLAGVLGIALLSLFWFNRHAELDNWAIYFFGAYGLGAAAWWASTRGRLHIWLGVIATVGVAALVEDFRLRIALALVVALLLGFSRRSGLLERWPDNPLLAWLGRISYSVFLVHFPVLLLLNGLFSMGGSEGGMSVLVTLIATWVTCVWAGSLFHHWIEAPSARWRLPFRLPRPALPQRFSLRHQAARSAADRG